MAEINWDHPSRSIDPRGCVATRVFVDHTVTFHLGDAEAFVVPRRSTKGYALVNWITVTILASGRIQVHANGTICKKDGTFSERWGRTSISVDLPDEAHWIDRAMWHIKGYGRRTDG